MYVFFFKFVLDYTDSDSQSLSDLVRFLSLPVFYLQSINRHKKTYRIKDELKDRFDTKISVIMVEYRFII